VIGSGPAGLSAAYYLTLFGYKVVVFEKEKVLGGTLRLIPPFRLPEEAIDREIEKLKNLGVEFRIRREWGREITLESLRKEGFKAVFLGIGGKEKDLEIKGRETVKGVFSASEFLKGVKERKRIKIGPRVVVIGGGFSAVDSARVARRAGAEEVFILYRRTKDEMPASLEEVAQAEKEGVRVMYLVAPVEIVSQEGQLKRLKLVNLTLGNEDETGRRKSEPVKGTEFFLTVDTLIKAVGQERVKVPSAPQLFTGGDLIQKQGNIVQALADGKKAAWAIDQFLKGDRKKEKKLKTVNPIFIREKYGYLPPQHRAEVDISEAPTAVFSFRKAVKEAGRCLNCGCGIGCGHCQKICPAEAIKEKNGFYEVDETKCEGCSMCYRVCFKKSIKLKI
jgi:NADPH-dependent glutamate synthase beta subunit-like oxidoreductase/Pyruvate/2-oxoacid:ferredoxin oxidoreductase delta subunit